MLESIGAGTALLVGGVGAAGASPGSRGPPSQGDTIVDVAVAADGFDVLVAAVEKARLAESLSGNRQLTVFAPTDQAFLDLLAGLEGVDSLDDIPVELQVDPHVPRRSGAA